MDVCTPDSAHYWMLSENVLQFYYSIPSESSLWLEQDVEFVDHNLQDNRIRRARHLECSLVAEYIGWNAAKNLVMVSIGHYSLRWF